MTLSAYEEKLRRLAVEGECRRLTEEVIELKKPLADEHDLRKGIETLYWRAKSDLRKAEYAVSDLECKLLHARSQLEDAAYSIRSAERLAAAIGHTIKK